MRRLLLLLLVLACAGVVVSRFAPKVEVVTVEGNSHYSYEQVLALANLAPGDPLLWVTKWSLHPLATDPWVHSVSVERVWPDTVNIALRERLPVLTDGVTSWADDGTVLAGASQELAGLPRLEGWGTPRTTEALALLELLGPYEPQVISYSPEGFEIQLTGTTLLTPSADALRAQWSAFVNHRGGRVAVYPWGVSTADERKD